MNKKIKVFCDPGTFFSLGDEQVLVGNLTVAQAELVAAQYPGRYVEVVSVAEPKPAEEAKGK